MSESCRTLFVLGAPRSGTTLVQRMLCLHPGSSYISNWNRRFPRLAPLAGLNRLAPLVPGVRRAVWFGSSGDRAYRYGDARPWWDRIFPQPTEGEPLFEASGVPDEPTEQYEGGPSEQEALASLLCKTGRWSGGEVLVVKRIANNRRVPLLLKAFPDARFLHVVRDGRAVASSLARVDWWEDSPIWWTGGTPRSWAAAGGDPVELCARHWVRELEAVREGLAAVEPDQQLMVRYEDIVADPLGTADEIATFGMLGTSESWLAELGTLRFPDQNEAWREAWSADELDRVNGWQSTELERYRYPQ